MPRERSRDDVLSVIVKHLEETLDEPPAAGISAETNIVGDLALDSLESFEMVAVLEDHYDMTIPVDAMIDVKTIGDVVEIVIGL